MKDERSLKQATEDIRRAIAKVDTPSPSPEIEDAIDQLVAALLSSSRKRPG